MKRYLNQFFTKMINHEKSLQTLTVSFCVGNYIAFSPFLFFHSIMVVVFSWLLRLNFAVTFAAAYGVNNPWTAIPVYTADYIFGHWLLHSVLQLDPSTWGPSWIQSMSSIIENTLGLPHICIWSFLIGGNVLGIIISIGLYPLINTIFSRLLTNRNQVVPS